jgi:hypothetical protein
MVASASAQLITSWLHNCIVTMHTVDLSPLVGGENRKTFIYKNGERTEVPDYATVSVWKMAWMLWIYFLIVFWTIWQVQAMFIGVVSVFVFIITIIGHEYVVFLFEEVVFWLIAPLQEPLGALRECQNGIRRGSRNGWVWNEPGKY